MIALGIGGALAANAHGRGLILPPIVGDVEQFKIVKHDGETVNCSREQNVELFKLAIGGYGLFGVISSVILRLVPQNQLRRHVAICRAESVVAALEKGITNGATYGDFQFNIDDRSPDFLIAGIVSYYTPVNRDYGTKDALAEPSGAAGEATKGNSLSENDWRELLKLAHINKALAFEKYSGHYLSTDKQIYSSDVFQLATYIENYHEELDHNLGSLTSGTELITELYIPRGALPVFLSEAAAILKRDEASVIYGTVRLIERDNETFMAWAKEPWACIVFNLHVNHTPHEIVKTSRSFCNLIDLSIKHKGSYYMTYHRYATATQLLACYPQLAEMVALKIKHDPNELFTSDWFEYCKKCISEANQS